MESSIPPDCGSAAGRQVGRRAPPGCMHHSAAEKRAAIAGGELQTGSPLSQNPIYIDYECIRICACALHLRRQAIPPMEIGRDASRHDQRDPLLISACVQIARFVEPYIQRNGVLAVHDGIAWRRAGCGNKEQPLVGRSAVAAEVELGRGDAAPVGEIMPDPATRHARFRLLQPVAAPGGGGRSGGGVRVAQCNARSVDHQVGIQVGACLKACGWRRGWRRFVHRLARVGRLAARADMQHHVAGIGRGRHCRTIAAWPWVTRNGSRVQYRACGRFIPRYTVAGVAIVVHVYRNATSSLTFLCFSTIKITGLLIWRVTKSIRDIGEYLLIVAGDLGAFILRPG